MSQVPWQLCTAAEWREQAVKHAYSVTLGKMLQNTPATVDEVEVPYLKAQHVQWDGVNLADLPTMWASPEEVDFLRVREGDLLVCEGGEVGRAAIVGREPELPTIIQNALHLVRGRDGSDTRFLLYGPSTSCRIGTGSHPSTTPLRSRTSPSTKFRDMRVWMPDERQQAAIADYLDVECKRLDDLRQEATRMIGLLRERRAALISAALTGTLDVDGGTDDSRE